MKAILGKKVGMTQIFDENGKAIPVTVVEAGPCTVVQVKTKDVDGYEAIQLGFGEVKEKKLTKPAKVREDREWTYGNSFTKGPVYSVGEKPKTAFAFRTAESFLNNIATAKASAAVDISQYKTGQTIYHKKFGEGVITEIAPEGDDLKLDISFEKVGHKRLMAKYANLEIKD